MLKNIIFFYLFASLTVFGQKKNLSEDITYNAIDYFVANPSQEGIKKLNTIEARFWKNQDKKSKEELMSIVVLDCNKAYFENEFGKTNQAITSYEKAWKIYQTYQLTNYDIVEYCLKPLGNLYTIIGDYDNAENTIKHYYFIANIEKNESNKIAAILNLSNVYQSSGKNTLAINLLENTLKTTKLSSIQKGSLLNNLGNNYLLSAKELGYYPKTYYKAEESYEKAIQLLKNEKSQSEALSNCYRNLASLNGQRSDFEKANSYFEKAKTLFFSSKNKGVRAIAKLYYEEALLLFKQKKMPQALQSIQHVYQTLIPLYSSQKRNVPLQRSLYAETVLLDALDLQADIYNLQNLPQKALQVYSLCFPIEEIMNSLLLFENSKIINQLRMSNRTEKCIAIYANLYKKENKIIYIEKAFQLAEKTKSGVLKSALSRNRSASKKEKQKIQELQFWNNEIVKEQQKGELANIYKINKAIKKQNETMLLLKELQASYNSFKEEPLDLNALYSKLESDNALMIYYFSGYEKMYYFTLGGSQNPKIVLNSFSNDAHYSVYFWQFIRYFNDANAITNDIKGYNHFGKIAYDKLHLPQKISFKNLIIIPDGALDFLPFEALITKESNTSNFEKMHYLLRDFNIVYNNSASFYLNAKPFSPKEKTVLGIFPVFEKTNYALTYSKTELQSIKNSFKGRFFEFDSASFQNFKNNAAAYSILHLSTHATAGNIDIPASIKFYDREVLYSELYHLNINPNLVVLSACETGIGKLYKSEGAMSVARGFQSAGAQNLLFSLWKVNDYTTSVFMGDFYKYVKKNDSYFEANAKAKLDFLKNKNISNAKKSPYYWAAFVYYGSLENKEKTNYLLIGFVIFTTFIGGFLLFKLITKRIKK
ncbi:CHAT domain-containing protein [Flavobacterium taihuense]|uniref:CHAT domain-containing protein n=1 Tax=Flavobacterium taihuense TaxID=2857508 RepID=A0ABS6XSU9_9FLAO|nr:CHAT domain-containing tetratricopeptide repeat protein [Flavobacterium taihuense]MBW4359311.1 CHAT domain-containing protein [Flavobacterium taihuense]